MPVRVSGHPGRTRLVVRAALLLSVLGLVAGPAAPFAAAAETIVTTPFPSLVVEPGDSATFTLTLRTDAAADVELTTTGLPEGWTARFTGGGATIGSAFVTPGNPVEVDLAVEVPDDAPAGETRFEVRTRSGADTASLPLVVRVEEQAAGSVSLTSDFPQLNGAAGGTFTFSLSLDNDTPAEQTFSMQATGPEGWTVSATPSGQSQATTTTVAAGASTTINVSAEAPDDIAAGDYPIQATVTGGGETVTADLLVTITGSYSLGLATANEVLSATANAGSQTNLDLVITNTGTAPITAVTLTAQPPTGWTVTFEPESIPQVDPNGTATVVAHITPTGDAITGDYNVGLTARATEDASDDIQIRVKVETPAFWWIAGLALIAIVFVGLWWVFRTYGRR
jgi:uncharacterized repeat protein (TIGR01451 family)